MVGEISERVVMARARSVPQDFKPRAISGLVLAGVGLAACYAGAAYFSALAIAIAAIMCWEWGRIVRAANRDAAMTAHLVAVLIGAMAAAWGEAAVGLVAVAFGAVAAHLLSGTRRWLSALGVLYVGVPAIALIWLRRDESYGFLAVLFLMTMVWTTDTFAYLCGTLIGGPKLWPQVSPNKTWAGLVGGVVFAALAGGIFALCIPDAPPAKLAVAGLVLSIVAQAGDLAESALKRMFGVKHASTLIPGHGGFMDRMDGVVVAATVVGLAALLMQSESPARALLFWF